MSSHHPSAHPSARRSLHRVGVATASLISFPKEHLLDSGNTGGGWIGDYQHRLLLFLYDLEEVRPRDLVPYFCSNPKSAYSVVRRLERMGVLRRVARGVYRVVGDAVRRLLRLPVRHIKGGARRGSAARFADGTTPASSASVPSAYPRSTPVPPAADPRAVATGSATTGRPRYLGLFLDNLRWRGLDGRYRQLPRSALIRHGDLDPGWLVTYSEVAHAVGGLVLDGVVVVYTNIEDLGRFGTSTVRVEWRPPSGYVGRNGLASALLLAREELVKAFRALATVLGEILPRRRLLELYSWLGGLWGVA